MSFAQATSKGFVLIQTKEVSMRPEDVKRVFQSNAEDLVEWITKGGVFLVVVANLLHLVQQSCFINLIATDTRLYLQLAVNKNCLNYYKKMLTSGDNKHSSRCFS